MPQPGPVRAPMRLVTDGEGGQGASVSALLARMRQSAFQGRKLGEAFEVWQRMIDGGSLICLGLAGSASSAGLGPLVTWLVERGYVDLIVSTSANVTEDLLEPRGAAFYQIDPDHVDDAALGRQGLYRFYDHVVPAADYDAMEDFTAGFFERLGEEWKRPALPGLRLMYEFGRWLEAQGLGHAIAAACYRHQVPLFVPAAPDGPLAEGYRLARAKGPVVDFFRDYEIAIEIMDRYMRPGRGTAAIFLGGGVPKDFLQITATSVRALRGSAAPTPHLAAIQITTDNVVFGGLGGAGLGTECISWGKESPDGLNVMVFTDLTIALPLLCQGLLERYGVHHTRGARAAIAADLGALLEETGRVDASPPAAYTAATSSITSSGGAVQAICVRCRVEGRAEVVGERPPLDDPTEVPGTCWTHKLESLNQRGDSAREAFLVIVGRHEPALYARVSEQFLDDHGVRVIFDRRKIERRRQTRPFWGERRRSDRRRPSDYWDDTRYHPVVVIATGQTGEALWTADAPPKASFPQERPMDITDAVAETRRQIDQWTQDSQDIFGRVIPGLLEQCATLARRAELAEGHSARLSREIEDLQAEIAKLRSEIDRLGRQRAEASDAVERGLNDMARLASDLLERLKGVRYVGLQQS
jgi:deoxyhypusine synthase